MYKISGSWEILALCEQPPVRMLSKGGGWQEEARGWVSVSRAWVSARQELRLGSCSVSSGSEEGNANSLCFFNPGHENAGAKQRSCAVSTLQGLKSVLGTKAEKANSYASVRSLNTHPPGMKAYATVNILAKLNKMYTTIALA